MQFFTRALAVIALTIGALAPQVSNAGVFLSVSVGIAPPVLPIYAQPICPGPNMLWTPGYWAYGPDGYFWVPGTWVQPPGFGILWTPGYWGWGGAAFLWHAGYWGPHVGFYGGVNYGFGYGGFGFGGGRWVGNSFSYNRSVTNVNVTNIHNTYNETVVNNNSTHVSYNGGANGLTAQPSAQERAYAGEPHTAPSAAQVQHELAAGSNPQLLELHNHGNPPIAATAQPGHFSGPGVTHSMQGPNAEANLARQQQQHAAMQEHRVAQQEHGAVQPGGQHGPVQHAAIEHPAAPHPAEAPHPHPAPHEGGEHPR